MNPDTRREAFEQMVREYTPALYARVRSIVQWHDDANDVLQNTYLKAWQALDSFRSGSTLYTWLYRIALNESLTHLSKVKDLASLADNEEAERSLESDPYFDGDETELLLQKAISTLPEKQRIVFNLKYFEEMKYQDMSILLNTSIGALKASYHLAVKKIESFFEQYD